MTGCLQLPFVSVSVLAIRFIRVADSYSYDVSTLDTDASSLVQIFGYHDCG